MGPQSSTHQNTSRVSTVAAQALLLLLLWITTADSAPVLWRDLAGNRRNTGVHVETGYPADLLDYVWHKYGDGIVALPLPQQLSKFYDYHDTGGFGDTSGIDTAISACLYIGLWYIHTHPAVKAIGQRYFTYFGRCTESMYYEMVVPVLFAFADVIDEIEPNDRYHPQNHGTGMFARYISAFIDTAPIFVAEPSDPTEAALLLSAEKYGGCVYKVQVRLKSLTFLFFFVVDFASRNAHCRWQ